ncbi:hypothetical protein DOY81_003211 [Sarcophaga bullata]|nr:hypothetical protein DOY81_003211 [Sarcophaga bullata]
MQQHIKDEQLLATDKKLITVQNQPPAPPPLPVPQPSISQSQSQSQSQGCDAKKHKKMTVSAATPKDDKDKHKNENEYEHEYENVEKQKNKVFDFITQHQQQEQLVEQVIDTLGKLENKSKENLVNTHVQQTPTKAATSASASSGSAPATETTDEQHIKSNLNQQTPSTGHTASASSNDVLVMQNCNVNNVLVNASSKNAAACNQDNDTKSTKGNESQLKLQIKEFADKMADKQFQKYDNQQQQQQQQKPNN